jgi:uncharacterized membrane protein
MGVSVGSAAVIACVALSGIFPRSMNNKSVWYGVLLVAAVLSLVLMFGTSLLLTRHA